MDAKFWDDVCASLERVSDEEWEKVLVDFDRRHPLSVKMEIEIIPSQNVQLDGDMKDTLSTINKKLVMAA